MLKKVRLKLINNCHSNLTVSDNNGARNLNCFALVMIIGGPALIGELEIHLSVTTCLSSVRLCKLSFKFHSTLLFLSMCNKNNKRL